MEAFLASLAGGLKYALTVEGHISHDSGSLFNSRLSQPLDISLFLM